MLSTTLFLLTAVFSQEATLYTSCAIVESTLVLGHFEHLWWVFCGDTKEKVGYTIIIIEQT